MEALLHALESIAAQLRPASGSRSADEEFNGSLTGSGSYINFTPSLASSYATMFVKFRPDVASDTLTFAVYDAAGGTGNLLFACSWSNATWDGSTLRRDKQNWLDLMLPTTARSIKITGTGGAVTVEDLSPNVIIMGYWK